MVVFINLRPLVSVARALHALVPPATAPLELRVPLGTAGPHRTRDMRRQGGVSRWVHGGTSPSRWLRQIKFLAAQSFALHKHLHSKSPRTTNIPTMAFDDDDENLILRSADPADPEDDEGEDLAPDYRQLAGLLEKKGRSGQEVRKGEKDFESHGTRAQESALESSRRVMEEVLSFQRFYTEDNWVRAWYFPEWWGSAGGRAIWEGNERIDPDELLLEDRVALVEHEKGFPARLLGRVVPGVKRTMPASGRTWILPEEALYLFERGTMELWWPDRSIGELFPPLAAEEGGPEPPKSMLSSLKDEDYTTGVPLSLQGAYAMLIGQPGEKGKVPLARFQVYSTLKRAGYHVVPAPKSPSQSSAVAVSQPGALWRWFASLIPSRGPPAFGPLVRPGLYRSYNAIYKQLSVIPRHKPTERSTTISDPEDPFRVHYHVWRAEGTFRKGNPPPPDFRVCVVDTREAPFPTLEQISGLLESTPYDPPPPPPKNGSPHNPGQMHRRVKHGYRNVLLAVVDHGIISFNRVCDAGFGEEALFEGFDGRLSASTGGPKTGGFGKGGNGGKGGRGGRGRKNNKRGGKA